VQGVKRIGWRPFDCALTGGGHVTTRVLVGGAGTARRTAIGGGHVIGGVIARWSGDGRKLTRGK
jgi:hypothetical protein